MNPKIQRALISVSDKLGLVDFVRGLAAAGVEIYSTGGTRRHLESSGIPIHDVSAYTGFPEMMDGRLKTLHPMVFGGILCRHDREDDLAALAEHDIRQFELVVVNLYPFEATVAKEGVTEAEAIEKIDIGGPSLVRAAAKNHQFVTIATKPEQYSRVLDEIAANGATTLDTRQHLARDAFAMTGAYDRAITDYFAGQNRGEGLPETINLTLHRKSPLRYGENPHQAAAVYRVAGARGPSLVSARQLNGKELSYNNLLDLDAALTIVRSLPGPAVSVIKHNNPCGAGTANTIAEACRRALDGDPLSAFGSVLGFNRTLDEETAELLAEPGLFIEGIVAPDFEAAAFGVLTSRPKWRSNVRLMQVGLLDESPTAIQFRDLEGGMLAQSADCALDPESEWSIPTKAQPDDGLFADLRFGWEMVRHVKSNAIVLCRDESLVGVGAGQMSRVDSVEIAIRKAGDRAQESILASDAFFPFPDSIEHAAKAGVVAVIQPGGSRKDDEVIAACDEFGLPMVVTGRRHFKH